MFYRKTQLAYVRKYDIVSINESTGEQIGAVIAVYHIPAAQYGSQLAYRVNSTEVLVSTIYALIH